MIRRRFRAQSLVEFGLVTPVFLIMLFGIIEGGRLLWTVHTLNNAAKEGSRYAMVRGDNSDLADAPANSAKIKDYVVTKSTALDPDGLTVTMNLLDGGMDDQERVQVLVTYDYSFIVGPFLGFEDTQLSADSTAIFSR